MENPSSPTTWCVSTTNKERIFCSWIRAIVIKDFANSFTERPRERMASTSLTPMKVPFPSIPSTPMTMSLMWKSEKVSARCCLRCGRVPMNRWPRRKRVSWVRLWMLTLNASVPTIASRLASTPSMNTSEMSIARRWRKEKSRWRSKISTSTTCSLRSNNTIVVDVMTFYSILRRTSTYFLNASLSLRLTKWRTTKTSSLWWRSSLWKPLSTRCED